MLFEKKGSFVRQLCPKRCLYLSFGDWFISLSVTSPGSIAVMPREGGPSYGRGLFRGAFVPHARGYSVIRWRARELCPPPAATNEAAVGRGSQCVCAPLCPEPAPSRHSSSPLCREEFKP